MNKHMIRRKFFVPESEIYRAYDDEKTSSPNNYIVQGDFEIDMDDDEPIDMRKATNDIKNRINQS